MADNSYGIAPNDTLLGPARRAVAVTKSNSTVFDATKRLFVGTGGDVAVVLVDATNSNGVIYKAASGSYLYVRAIMVLSTGTDASAIVAEY